MDDFVKLINKKVKIVPLNLEGRIKEVSITRLGIKYLVRYFYNMQIDEAYMYEDEFIILD